MPVTYIVYHGADYFETLEVSAASRHTQIHTHTWVTFVEAYVF